MLRKLLLAVVVFGLALGAAPAVMADTVDNAKWSVFAEARARWERLENYFDFNDKGSPQDAFTFSPYRIRVGVDGELSDKVAVKIEVQNFGVWGNQTPFRSAASIANPVFQNLDGNGIQPGDGRSETE